ncbi:MAG: twin-arginine translocase subunit TatC [Gemmatimonadaceae bacterium]
MSLESHAKEMPFLDHLEELRWRILKSLLAVILCVGASFALLMKFDVIALLSTPILPYLHGHKLVYTHPGEAFSIFLTTSVSIGVVLALPMIVYQLWAFVAPALYAKEKRVVMPVIGGAILLFVGGVALAFFGVMPLALPWLMGFQTDSLEPLITASEYFDFAVSLCLAFGISFELPIAILALAALGIVSGKFLSRYRRHAIVLVVIIGAFLTPGDLIWTTIAMSVPLYMLYELTVVLVLLMERRRARRSRAEH